MGLRLVLALLTALLLCVGQSAGAAERRIALVIGESAYEGKPIETAANDAGLIAQTLQAAGFDVSGARDLDEESLRGSLRDFLEKARSVGPDGVAFIYFAGAAAQLEGDNYLVPVGAPIASDADIPLHGARLSDYLKPLASMGLKAAVIVLDAARALPYSIRGQPLAGGLALYEPGPSLLLAFNAAPGTIAPPEPGPYGVYAHALAEMIRAGGMPVAQVFDQTRLRVLETTRGAQIPWNSQGFDTPFIFFERTSQAPSRGVDEAALRGGPIAQFTAQDAFAAAVARDTLQSYQDFLTAFPDDPMAARVRAIIAARREALFWRKTRILNTPAAYWTYVRTYPRGPHVWDARRLLAILASPPEPPAAFAPIDLGYPPPPPPEIVFVSRPVIFFGDPVWGFAPPPPPPLFFLPPPPPDFIVLPPPVVFGPAYVLPVPPFVPVPIYVQPPAFIAPPPGNVFFANIHNSVVVDVNQNVVIANPQGRVLSAAPVVAGAVAGAAGAAIGASLPRYIANRTAAQPNGALPPGQGFQRPGQAGPASAPGGAPQAQGLPPAQGHGLPPQGQATGAQQPPLANHALPQPGANVLSGQGAAPAQTSSPHDKTPGGHGMQAPAQGHALPTQGQAPGVPPTQGSHALPQPGANALSGQGAAPAQTSSPRDKTPGGQGLQGSAQGHALPTQGQAPGGPPPQGNHNLPQPAGNLLQDQGRQAKGQPSQTQPPQNSSAPPPSQGGHGHGRQTQAPMSPLPSALGAPSSSGRDSFSGRDPFSGAQGAGRQTHGAPSHMQAAPNPPPSLSLGRGGNGYGGSQGPGLAPMAPRQPNPPPQPMMQGPPPQAMAPRPQPMMMQHQASPPQSQPQRSSPSAGKPQGQEHH